MRIIMVLIFFLFTFPALFYLFQFGILSVTSLLPINKLQTLMPPGAHNT